MKLRGEQIRITQDIKLNKSAFLDFVLNCLLENSRVIYNKGRERERERERGREGEREREREGGRERNE